MRHWIRHWKINPNSTRCAGISNYHSMQSLAIDRCLVPEILCPSFYQATKIQRLCDTKVLLQKMDRWSPCSSSLVAWVFHPEYTEGGGKVKFCFLFLTLETDFWWNKYLASFICRWYTLTWGSFVIAELGSSTKHCCHIPVWQNYWQARMSYCI